VSQLSGREKLHTIQFLNYNDGWVVSDNSLYKTADGGVTWKLIHTEMPTDAYFVSICFINSSLGWVVLGRSPSDMLDYQSNEVWLWHTADGGQSWSVQYTGKALSINRVHFVNEQEGWAVGARYVKRATMEGEHFVMHTSDQGRHWVNVSDNFNQLVPPHPLGSYVMDIYTAEPFQATLLTLRGQLVYTRDSGQSWQLIGAVQNEPNQTIMPRIGALGDMQFWVVGGADSKEGMWGMLARMDSTNSWVKYRAGAVIFRDAAFLSGDQILACGSIQTDENAVRFGGRRDGIILHSSDGGRSWAIVYRNAKARSINAIVAIDSNHIWAVGDNGLTLRLQTQS
jgi:photosystem II stability/assembly factor-like uncharacterized protein